ncbi:MAG: DUF6735 family protein [Halapricum sp.]
MAHRALVAYERPDGRYDVHTSRWGGLDCRLARTITGRDPYASGDVDPVPRVVARPFDEVLTMVDLARHEAVYRVSAEYEIETYLPLWFGLAYYVGGVDLDDRPDGVLVAVENAADAADLREWFLAAKDTVAEAVTGGYLDLPTAQSVLADALSQRVEGRTVLEPGQSGGSTER